MKIKRFRILLTYFALVGACIVISGFQSGDLIAGSKNCKKFESIKFVDSNLQEIFLDRLSGEEVEFKINGDGEVVPLANHKCKFNQVFEEVMEKHTSELGFSIPDSMLTEEIIKNFRDENIDFEYFIISDRVTFSFEAMDDRDRAEMIYDEQFRDEVNWKLAKDKIEDR